MNLCTPGNCICDAREWEGDTDCFGNTAEDDARMRAGGHRCHLEAPHGPHRWTNAIPEPGNPQVLNVFTDDAAQLECPGLPLEEWRAGREG